uniref:uncharacterized protein LOC118152743 n=1 Tax=Callithrix jacchus TaxID=9483 RepID=UPI00159F5BFD|nr:uncharacterized protein LOC118152743 [Callithrix jacchus]
MLGLQHLGARAFVTGTHGQTVVFRDRTDFGGGGEANKPRNVRNKSRMNSRAASPWARRASPGYLSCSCVSRPGFAVVPGSRNRASPSCGRRPCWRSSGRGLLPHSWARGPAEPGEAAEDLARDDQRERQGWGRGS